MSRRAPLLLALFALLAGSPAQAGPPRYRAVLIAPDGIAWDLNRSNHVVGSLGASRTNPTMPRAFVWTGDSPQEIAGDNSYAYAINDSGDVVGMDWENYQPFLYRDGNSIDLGEYHEAWDINNHGVIVGAKPWDYGIRPARWDGSWEVLAPLVADYGDGTAFAINDQGDIVGHDENGSQYGQPVLWQGSGSPTALALPQGRRLGNAFTLNDSGQIAGIGGWYSTTTPPVAVMWEGGSLTNLSGADAAAYGINAAGQIVGESENAAVLWWTEGNGYTRYALESLVDNPADVGALFEARSINDCGYIVGESAKGAFLLLPDDTTDTDGDAISDQWEKCGIDVDMDGIIDLRLDGADPLHKDLYVELDLMTGAFLDPGTVPMVVQAFATVPNSDLAEPNPDGQPGITLHLTVDEADLPAGAWQRVADPWPAEFDALKLVRFGTVAEQSDINSQAILEAKAMVYRYGIWAKSFTAGPQTVSGCAEIGGNDFFVSLLQQPWNGGDVEEQSATLMHEIGHTLGLTHGGSLADADVNYKPNYFSLMNYSWQFPSTTGSYPCDWLQSWRLNFSNDVQPRLDELVLLEAAGIPGTPAGMLVPFGSNYGSIRCTPLGQGDVNFDEDMGIDAQPVSVDLNHISPAEPPSPGQFLEGWDDWANLDFNFRDDDEYADGVHGSAAQVTEMTGDQYIALHGGGTVDVVRDMAPLTVRLAAWPSPFRFDCRVAFALPTAGRVRLAVYDVAGNRVATLLDEHREAGVHAHMWKPGAGAGRAPGVYYLVLDTPAGRRTQEIVRLR